MRRRGRVRPVRSPFSTERALPCLTKKTGTPLVRPTGEDYVVSDAYVIRTEPALDKKGQPVLDKDGTPLLRLVQAKDGNGFPAFETVEKVYDIAKMPTSAMQRIRGKEISMIFQEPMTSLNPLFTIGNQLDEVVLLHTPGADKELAKNRSIEMLKLVGIAMPENVYNCYPHELSGGMRQRVMIAMALACQPQAHHRGRADHGARRHHSGAGARSSQGDQGEDQRLDHAHHARSGRHCGHGGLCGRHVRGTYHRKGDRGGYLDRPMHPYTIGLQKSKPVINKDVDTLYSIHGQVPNPIDMPNYCYFKDRCDYCVKECGGDYPPLVQVSPTHFVACYRAHDKKEGKQ